MSFGDLGEFEFIRLEGVTRTEEQVRATVPGASIKDIESVMAHFKRCEHWASGVYHVAVDKSTEHGFGELDDGIEFWHLSIKRHDREPMNDWRVMQNIKTAIAGPDAEAVEIYPAEERVVDTANQYHLWTLIGSRFPFGFGTGARSDNESGGSRQRPGSGGDSADHWSDK